MVVGRYRQGSIRTMIEDIVVWSNVLVLRCFVGVTGQSKNSIPSLPDEDKYYIRMSWHAQQLKIPKPMLLPEVS